VPNQGIGIVLIARQPGDACTGCAIGCAARDYDPLGALGDGFGDTGKWLAVEEEYKGRRDKVRLTGGGERVAETTNAAFYRHVGAMWKQCACVCACQG
jgi:hypothetical protein